LSFDLIAYFSSKPRNLPRSRLGAGWVVNIEQPLAVEPEDVPPGLKARMGRRRWQVEVHREGLDCPGANEALREIAASLLSDGAAIFDPQVDQVRLGHETWPVPHLAAVGDNGSGFTLHCFFEQADEFGRDLIGRLLDFLEENLPEGLPHRYGTYEPPPYRWDVGGRELFLDRWVRSEAPYWIGKTPVAHVFESFDYKLGRSPRIFRAGRIAFEFRSKLADDPGRLLSVLQLGEWLAQHFDAFYTALVPGTVIHGPFWKGMIPGRHLMAIVGPPLVTAWNGFADGWTPLSQKHRQLGSSSQGIVEFRPPAELCYQAVSDEFPPPSPSLRRGAEYAPIFPFDPDVDPYQPL
jgi:hypothetical protein